MVKSISGSQHYNSQTMDSTHASESDGGHYWCPIVGSIFKSFLVSFAHKCQFAEIDHKDLYDILTNSYYLWFRLWTWEKCIIICFLSFHVHNTFFESEIFPHGCEASDMFLWISIFSYTNCLLCVFPLKPDLHKGCVQKLEVSWIRCRASSDY